MKQVLKTNERNMLYMVGSVYVLGRWGFVLLSDRQVSSILLETGIIITILMMTRECVMYKRIRKMNVQLICHHKPIIYFLRGCGVGLYFIGMGLSEELTKSMLFIILWGIERYVLPRPISEGVFISKDRVILRNRILFFSEIDDVNYYDETGDLAIICDDEELRVYYHTKKQKLQIYNRIKEIMNKGYSQ